MLSKEQSNELSQRVISVLTKKIIKILYNTSGVDGPADRSIIGRSNNDPNQITNEM